MEYVYEKLSILEKLTEEILPEIKTLYVFCATPTISDDGLNLFIITNGDKVYGLGSNIRGCLGFGHQNRVVNLELVTELCNKEIVEFSYSFNYMIARSREGKIFSWGHKSDNYEIFTQPQKMNLINITEVCSGKNFSILLNGSKLFIYAGIHSSYSSNFNHYDFKLLKKLDKENFLQVSCGENHSMFLTDKGNVYTWGDNEPNKTVIRKFFEMFRLTGRKYNKYEPKHVRIEKNDNTYEKFARIACGKYHSLLLTTDGHIYTSGRNHCGQLGNRIMKNQSNFFKINNDVKFIDVTANFCNDISIALSNRGDYYIWGECGKKTVLVPEKTPLKSPFSIFAEYYQITHRTMHIIIDEKQLQSGLLQNGKYRKQFNEFFVIGIGSSGVVCRSQWIYDYKNYAIKKIPIFKELKDKLFKELKIMSELKCDYVVHCIAFWIEDNYMDVNDLRESDDISLPYGHPFLDDSKSILMHIQLELCFGTLKQFIKRLNDDEEPFPYSKWPCIKYYIACELLTELLECIDYLHKHDPPIIHRDLKPTNILITGETSRRLIKLSDFGSVTTHEFDEQSHTQGVGTFKYMAPEIIMSRKYDTKADIYSLGIIIQELFDITDEKGLQMPTIYDKKLKHLQILSNKSTSLTKCHRPECADMLKEKNSWASTWDDLNGSDEILEFRSYIEKYKDKSDFLSIIILELLGRNESENSKKKSIPKNITIFESRLGNKFNERELYTFENQQSLEERESDLLKTEIPEYSGQENTRYFDKYIKKEKYGKEFIELNMISHGSYSIVCESLCKKDKVSYAIKKIPFNYNYQSIRRTIEFSEFIRTLNKTFVVDYKSFWIENNYMKDSADDIAENIRLSSGHEIFDENNDLLLHIQMELCDKTLREIIKQVNNELNQKTIKDLTLIGYFIASEILIEILECVDYLHKQVPPIIHRDLKPTNILMTNGENGRFMKLADFDSATFHATDERSHTQASGTFKYMAPEVLGTRRYDTKADIYSIGIIISELFMFDFNSPTDVENENDSQISQDFKHKFQSLLENAIKMKSIDPSSRPDCGKLLVEKQYWSLSSSDLKKKCNFDCDIQGKEETFHFKFIQTKMKLKNQAKNFNENLSKNLDVSNQNIIESDLWIKNLRIVETKCNENNTRFKREFTETEIIGKKKLEKSNYVFHPHENHNAMEEINLKEAALTPFDNSDEIVIQQSYRALKDILEDKIYTSIVQILETLDNEVRTFEDFENITNNYGNLINLVDSLIADRINYLEDKIISLLCLKYFASKVTYSRKTGFVRNILKETNKKEIFFNNLFTAEEISRRYRKLASHFHPDKINYLDIPKGLEKEYKNLCIELFQSVSELKEKQLNDLKGTSERVLTNFHEERAYGFWKLAIDFRNAHKQQWDKLKLLKEEELREMSSKTLMSESISKGRLAYQQYREACKLADKDKQLKIQIKLRGFMALSLYISNQFLEAQLYALSAINLIKQNSSKVSKQDLNKAKAIFDKVRGGSTGVISTQKKTEFEKCSINPYAIVEKGILDHEFSVFKSKATHHSINDDFEKKNNELMVKCDRAVVCWQPNREEILLSNKRDKILKVVGGTMALTGAVTGFGAVGLGTAAGVGVALGFVGAFSGIGLFAMGLYGGYRLLKKGNELLEEPKIRENLNEIIRKALLAYDEGEHQLFIEELSKKYNNGSSLLKLKRRRQSINHEDIVESLLTHGFKPDGIAYLLNLIGEVLNSGRIRIEGITSEELRIQGTKVLIGVLSKKLEEKAKRLDDRIHEFRKKSIKSNQDYSRIAREYKDDIQKNTFVIRLEEMRNTARINLAIRNILNDGQEEIERAKTVIKEVRESINSHYQHFCIIETRLEVLEDFLGVMSYDESIRFQSNSR